MTPEQNQRLYVIVNGELPFGYQTAQAIHAVTEFSVNDYESYSEWINNGNTIVVLKVDNIYDLVNLKNALDNEGYDVHPFQEPDLGWQLTAFAVTPDVKLRNRFVTFKTVGS